MSDDLLQRATGALREQGEDAVGPGKHQILQTIRHERQVHARRMAVLVPVAVLLVTSTAIAAASGKLTGLWQAGRNLLLSQETMARPAQQEPTSRHAAPAQRPEPRPAVAPEPMPTSALPRVDAPAVAPVAEPANEPAFHGPAAPQRPRTAHAPAKEERALPEQPRPAPQEPAPASPDALATFRRAQQLHFGQRQWGAALAAWDAYLHEAPRGELAPEARWNRAICLLRLDRRSEARQALQVFARGTEGGYRQQEAQALLKALLEQAETDPSAGGQP